MIKKVLKIAAVSLILILLMDYANRILDDADILFPESIEYSETKLKLITPAEAENLDWNDDPPVQNGLAWAKASFHFPEKRKRELIVAFLGAYELYWEGVLIGQSGQVSETPEGEAPGYIDKKYILPDSLAGKGEKTLLVRFSNHQATKGYWLADFSIEPYNEFYNRSVVQSMLIYALAGIFLIVAVYYFFMYANSFRNPAFFLFALLCLVACVLIVYAYSRNYYPYTYPMYPTRQQIMGALGWSISVLLPLFYVYYFDFFTKNTFG